MLKYKYGKKCVHNVKERSTPRKEDTILEEKKLYKRKM